MEKLRNNHFAQLLNVKIIKKKDGSNYSVRGDRSRFFFPDEWKLFYSNLRTKPKITFDFLINTGARIMEIQNIKVSDVDLERGNIILRVTKKIVNRIGVDKEGKSNPRVITISSEFAKRIRKAIKDYELKSEDYFPILSTPAGNQMLKRILKKLGVIDWQMFSLHNIRKTSEMFMLAMGIDWHKVVKMFGHSENISLKHYLSPDVFSFDEKREIKQLMGDLRDKMMGDYRI